MTFIFRANVFVLPLVPSTPCAFKLSKLWGGTLHRLPATGAYRGLSSSVLALLFFQKTAVSIHVVSSAGPILYERGAGTGPLSQLQPEPSHPLPSAAPRDNPSSFLSPCRALMAPSPRINIRPRPFSSQLSLCFLITKQADPSLPPSSFIISRVRFANFPSFLILLLSLILPGGLDCVFDLRIAL